MFVATGTVKDGKIVVEGLTLSEGTVVTILTDDDSPAVKLPPALEQELQDAIDEADPEEGGAPGRPQALRLTVAVAYRGGSTGR